MTRKKATSPAPRSMPHTPISQSESLLPVWRAFIECQRQIDRVVSREIEAQGLTQGQFDVLVTLGDTAGMTCKALGEQTLITKGTLTPVLDRLEAKGLIRRMTGEQDRRQSIISLTEPGQALYERLFMPHVEAMRARIDVLTPAEQERLIQLLHKLKSGFA